MIGESNETSPSWTSPPSSAMETPNETDQQLTFDFSKRYDVDPDLTNQLDPPKIRVNITSFYRYPIHVTHFLIILTSESKYLTPIR